MRYNINKTVRVGRTDRNTGVDVFKIPKST